MVVAKASEAGVRIVTRCSSVEEFLTVFRPLCRGDVLFVATDESIDVGTALRFSMTLATGDALLQGRATVVDPFANGLATAGYAGIGLRLGQLSGNSRAVLDALHASPDGTMPFGIPKSGDDGVDRVKCDVVPDSQLALPASEEPASSASDASAGDAVPEPVIEPMGWSRAHVDAEEATVAEPIGETHPVEEALRSADPLLPAEPGAAHAPIGAGVPEQIPITASPKTSLSTQTQLVRSAPRGRIAIVASLAAALGLGGGYLLWGRDHSAAVAVGDREGPGGASPTAATSPELDVPTASIGSGEPPTSAGEGPDRADLAPAATPRPDAGQPDAPTAASTPPEPEGGEGTCTARLQTTPAGAAVFSDSTLLGATPYRGPVPCGAQQISFRLPGFADAQATAQLAEGESHELSVELERPKHRLRIITRPRRALVKIDGKKVGRSPVNVSVPGFEPVSVTILKRGFKRYREEMVADKQRTVRRVRLRRR